MAAGGGGVVAAGVDGVRAAGGDGVVVGGGVFCASTTSVPQVKHHSPRQVPHLLLNCQIISVSSFLKAFLFFCGGSSLVVSGCLR